MLYFDGLFGLVMLGLWLYCLIDVITTDAACCRNLPKLLWVFIVLLLPDIGSIAWLVAGHPWQAASPRTGPVSRYPEYDRPGRHIASNPDDDEEFLRGLRERAEQQRRDYQARRAQEQLRAEQERQQPDDPRSPEQPGRND